MAKAGVRYIVYDLKAAVVLVVTHAPNISQAFRPEGAGLADGEALVFQPDGKRPWFRLAAVYRGGPPSRFPTSG